MWGVGAWILGEGQRGSPGPRVLLCPRCTKLHTQRCLG